MHEQQNIRIRLFGTLDALRSDGTVVEQCEWKTGKTRDLLRLLALADGHPVRVAALIAKLWPDASPSRARNSLGTAASQIRGTFRESCVTRQADALVLQGAWVDVNAFKSLVGQARFSARASAPTDVLTNARAALSLYRGDFHAHDDESAWARGERHLLRRLRVETLCDASVAANDVGLPREALDLASTAVALDPAVEAAHRSVMRAHAQLGEVGMALRAYEACRSHLAHELGADPSPQTQELHLRILRGPGDLQASGALSRLRDPG
ncbi:MAG: family transcriptional regulator, regulator of embCAB operon [Nocardioidaceae bacterium]|jgi:DNA-binding SARP family transcriptional activator|nr:family transcriptional regulator, regulator of embCAB operon [Nocardioidaceae bacterium]